MTRKTHGVPRRNSRPATSQARKTASNAIEVLPNHFDVNRAYRLNPFIREGRYYLSVDGCSLQLLTPSSDESSWLDLPEASYVAVSVGDCYHCGHVEDYELYWEYDGFVQTLTLQPAQCDCYLVALEPGKKYPLTAYEQGPDGDVRPVRTWSAELCWSG